MPAQDRKGKPWQVAFVAYCNGMSIDEIAASLSLSVDSLKHKIADERWADLRTKLPLATMQDNGVSKPVESALAPETKARLDLLFANRKKNYEVFARLRDHLAEQVEALASGKAKVLKLFFSAKLGMVVEKEVVPGPGDWVNIATYARTVSEGTYRALGDFAAQEKPGQDAAAGATNAPAPAITIIIPTAIAEPRQERQSKGQVIDVQALLDEKPAN